MKTWSQINEKRSQGKTSDFKSKEQFISEPLTRVWKGNLQEGSGTGRSGTEIVSDMSQHIQKYIARSTGACSKRQQQEQETKPKAR